MLLAAISTMAPSSRLPLALNCGTRCGRDFIYEVVHNFQKFWRCWLDFASERLVSNGNVVSAGTLFNKNQLDSAEQDLLACLNRGQRS